MAKYKNDQDLIITVKELELVNHINLLLELFYYQWSIKQYIALNRDPACKITD